jgi:RNA polymerase sigma-70 factor (ECF subfamily)
VKNLNRATEFATFYESTKDSVFRAVLLARAGEFDSAEDAVAEAYEKAFLQWDSLTTHPNPTAWVIRTAINHRISMWRRQRRKPMEVKDATHPQAERLDPALIRLIRELPKGQREVLALRVLLDFSTEQTAQALGVKQGTVKKQLHRALQSLRLHLVTHEAKEVWQ